MSGLLAFRVSFHLGFLTDKEPLQVAGVFLIVGRTNIARQEWS